MPSADGDGRSPSTRSSIAARPPVLPPLDLAVDQDNEQELLALPEPSNNNSASEHSAKDPGALLKHPEVILCSDGVDAEFSQTLRTLSLAPPVPVTDGAGYDRPSTESSRYGSEERPKMQAGTATGQSSRIAASHDSSSSKALNGSMLEHHSFETDRLRSRLSTSDFHLAADLSRPKRSKSPVFPLKPGSQPQSASKYRRPSLDAQVSPPLALESTEHTWSPSSTKAPPPPHAHRALSARSSSHASLTSLSTSSSGPSTASAARSRAGPPSPLDIRKPSSASSIRSASSSLPSTLPEAPQSIFANPERTKRPITDLLPKFFRSKSSTPPGTTSSSSETNNPYLAARRSSAPPTRSFAGNSRSFAAGNKRSTTTMGGSLAVLDAALATSQAWSPAGAHQPPSDPYSSTAYGAPSSRRPSVTTARRSSDSSGIWMGPPSPSNHGLGLGHQSSRAGMGGNPRASDSRGNDESSNPRLEATAEDIVVGSLGL